MYTDYIHTVKSRNNIVNCYNYIMWIFEKYITLGHHVECNHVNTLLSAYVLGS